VTKNTPEQAGLYLFHGTGHPLGLQTHDVYDRARAYEAGMVFTNEPGVYVRKDDILGSRIFGMLTASEQASMRAAVQRYDGIGIRIEDDVLITPGDPKVLSAGAPRTVEEIEAWMALRVARSCASEPPQERRRPKGSRAHPSGQSVRHRSRR
jgi:Xaa-Pro aminopeptidase